MPERFIMTAGATFSRRVRRVLALEGCEQRVFLSALVAMPAFALALRLAGFGRMQRWVGRVACAPRREPTAATIAFLVAAAARRGPIRASCLVRGLVTTFLLRRHGFDARLRVGVRLLEGRLEAHAWTEFDGMALAEAADVAERYEPFPAALGDMAKTRP
jgi:hypothetical protein